MPELPKRKVGLVSCSGEEMAAGTITRLATLKVLETLRPDQTVTICLPLFLAGGEGDRAFARYYPTIAIDGCDKRCAALGTEYYSSKPAAGIVVRDLCPSSTEELGTARRLNAAGLELVNAVAAEIARHVDRLLGGRGERSSDNRTGDPPPVEEKESTMATCSCGSGIPVRALEIGGRRVEVLALPLILRMFRDAGKPAGDETTDEMLETVRLYNQVPDGEEASWKLALAREYASYCAEGR